MKPVIVFDLNETLLDMSALDPAFGRIFAQSDPAQTRKNWFSKVLELFLTATITHRYRSFDELTGDALHMLGGQLDHEITAEDRTVLRNALGDIPPYPDVRPGLERLRAAGFTLATLTNSTAASVNALLEKAQLTELFDQVLSVDAIDRYKPAREAYDFAATRLGVSVDRILLVAAHAWDIAGADAAGCATAFVARPGKALSPATPEPLLRADDVASLAEQLVARYA